MGIQVNSNFVHWNYYLALEQDLTKVSRFIEFAEPNFQTYSIELAHLLLAASSEIDVVLKELCNIKNNEKQHHNINEYKQTVTKSFPELINEKCFISRYGIELQPWSNWNGNENPIWWRSYNNVKHQRNLHFQEANLKNTLNSMAALSLVTLYYYKEFLSTQAHQPFTFKEVNQRLQPQPSLIEFSPEYTYAQVII